MANPHRIGLAAAAAGLACSAGAAAQVIADSVADFSGTQGQGGWHYGFYDGDQPAPYTPADFEQMPLFGMYSGNLPWWSRTCSCRGGYWTLLSNQGGHPNGLNGTEGRVREVNWAVRRWTSDHEGQVIITGRLWKNPNGASNGVRGTIFVDGAPLWSQFISGTNGTGVTYRVGACVSVGSVLDWAVDPVNGHDWVDDFGFTATVTARECYVNCDCSAELDVFDFLCFQNRYAAADPYACDCDTGSGPLVCDIFDFLCFQNAFAAGCP